MTGILWELGSARGKDGAIGRPKTIGLLGYPGSVARGNEGVTPRCVIAQHPTHQKLLKHFKVTSKGVNDKARLFFF